GRHTPQPHRGQDVQVDLTVSFEQAFSGTTAKVELDRPETCAICSGSGARPGTSRTTCRVCGGSGQTSDGQGMFAFSRPCTACAGAGSVIENPCAACRGAGSVVRRKPITVNVPAGATDGGKLRFKGKGQPGASGGPSGDLYVVTRIAPHAFYRREGADVTFDLPITFAEAALGAEVTVPAPDGTKVKLKIPSGTASGKVMRVRGKGAPKLKGGGAGDLKVRARIVVPESLTDAQREALEAFSAESDQDVRAHIR
ncbi:MAG: molecular chaperone DnaJ, partial [Actinobacteria bacterium]